MENDANVAALGEAKHGAGQKYKLVFYVTLGSGVGGGLVLDGKIYHGVLPGEAEVGHIRLNPEGHTLEDCCSGWAVDRKVWKAIRREPDSLLCKLAGKNTSGEARFLKTALEQNDATAHELMRETTRDLGFGLSHVVHLFHPDIIILGGGLSFLGHFLQEPTQKALKANTMNSFLPGPAVVLAQLGEDAVPVGALELIRSQESNLLS
jgi:glucokinase